MKITFLLPTVSLSGGIRVIAIYAKWLAEHGHEVVLISPPHNEHGLKGRLHRALAKFGLWRNKEKVPSYLDGTGLDHRVLNIWRAPTDKDVPPADVIVATWWETAEWAASLSADRGARVHFIQGHELFDFVPQDRCKAVYRLPFHKIVIARWLADVMAEAYGDAHCDLVSNSVDHKQFFAPERGKQARPCVGFLYHETTLKGLDVTLVAVSRLKAIYPDLRVIAFGSKEPSGLYEFDPGIEFFRAPDQQYIREIYAQCDAWITTSRSEGFNLPAMEAMSCRTPLVATRTGWPAEAIRDGENGFLVAIDDLDGVVESVQKILDLSDTDWRVLSENAFRTVADTSWEKSSKAFESALVHAIERASRGEVAGLSKGK